MKFVRLFYNESERGMEELSNNLDRTNIIKKQTHTGTWKPCVSEWPSLGLRGLASIAHLLVSGRASVPSTNVEE